MRFTDRKPTKPNRFKITRDDGSTYYVILERADEPTEDGTPLNAEILNAVMEDIESAQTTANGKENIGTAAKLLNRTNAVNEANTEYEKFMARGTSLNSEEVNPTANGLIAWTFE